MTKFKLLKDLPGIQAGATFRPNRTNVELKLNKQDK